MRLIFVPRLERPYVVLPAHVQTRRKDGRGPVEQVPHGRVRPVLCRAHRLRGSGADGAEDGVEAERVEVVKVLLTDLVPASDILLSACPGVTYQVDLFPREVPDAFSDPSRQGQHLFVAQRRAE